MQITMENYCDINLYNNTVPVNPVIFIINNGKDTFNPRNFEKL